MDGERHTDEADRAEHVPHAAVLNEGGNGDRRLPIGCGCVADHLVSHHPGMPFVGLAQQTVGTTRGLLYRLHVPRARRCVRQAIVDTASVDGHSLSWFWALSTSFASPWTIHL